MSQRTCQNTIVTVTIVVRAQANLHVCVSCRSLCRNNLNEDGTPLMPLHHVYKGGSWLLTRPEEERRQAGTLLEPLPIDYERTSSTEHLTGSRVNIQVSEFSAFLLPFNFPFSQVHW